MKIARDAIRFAVVGLGRIGARHAEVIRATPGLSLVAVSDPDAAARGCFGESQSADGVRIFDDFAVMLKHGGFDWVVIASPSQLHHDMTIAALTAGYHVVVEKPAAGSAAEGRCMSLAADRAGRHLTVHQTLRYQADTLLIKQVIESGALGEVFQVYRGQSDFSARDDWQIWRCNNGGALSNVGSHFIDAALLMMPGQPRIVFASMRQVLNGGDCEDHYKIVVRMDHGGTVESEYLCSPLPKVLWHVCGTRGAACIPATLPVATMHVKTLDGDEWTRSHDFRLETVADSAHGRYFRDLLAALHRGAAPPVTMESVIRQLRVLDAGRRSASHGMCEEVEC